MVFRLFRISIAVLLLAVSLTFVACGGGSKTASSSTGRVTVSVSDPPTCSAATGGPYRSVYVTVADVLIHSSATASDNDPGWIDLTPQLKSAPVQVDLLGLPNAQCFLKTFGASAELQAGTYQQIRVVLSDVAPAGATNACGGVVGNCLIYRDDVLATNPQPLQLSSEMKNGIKIPSGQIAGGAFTIAAGQTRDLNLDFNTCASIVNLGNGGLRLKPVLHAGDVSLNSTPVNGQLVDAATGAPLPATAKTVVTLQAKDASGVDRVIMQTTADSTGAFAFCPVAGDGPYDVVAVAIDQNSNVTYGPTIVTGVKPGSGLGKIPVATLTSTTSKAPVTLTGQVTSANGSAGAPIDAQVSALQQVALNGGNVFVTVPLALQAAGTEMVVTASAGACPANTNCGNYTLVVPAANPTVGVWNGTSATYVAPAASAVNYEIDVLSTAAGGTNQAICSPSRQTSAATAVTPGATINVPVITFTGCTP